MLNYWLVAKHEYRQTVIKRSFIISTLAVPLGLALLIALVILVEISGENRSPVGFVDHAGFLDASLQAMLSDAGDRIEIRAFEDEDAARDAVEQEQIQAYFVFPPDYRQTLKTQLYFLEDPPSTDAWREFEDFVRLNLVHGMPAEVSERLLAGPDIAVYDINSQREFSESAFVNVIIPIAASFFFFFATMSAAGYLLGVVATEKENRTMEIMVTSVTPGQLIGGKAMGLLAVCLTQLAIYMITVVVGLRLAMPYVEPLQQATVPWAYLGVAALFFAPAYTLVAALMVAIGGAVNEMQQAQQIAGIVNLFFMAPIILLGALMNNSASPFMVFLTLFPSTAFLTISLRWGLGTIPVWQLGISWLLLVATTALMMWVAARVFRSGMLRYGQPLTWKAVVASMRQG
jgi:ABC-2 type transport system permease protein